MLTQATSRNILGKSLIFPNPGEDNSPRNLPEPTGQKGLSFQPPHPAQSNPDV